MKMTIWTAFLIIILQVPAMAQVQCDQEISNIFSEVYYRRVLPSGYSNMAHSLHTELSRIVYQEFPEKFGISREEELKDYLIGLELGSEVDEKAQWLKTRAGKLMEAYLKSTPCFSVKEPRPSKPAPSSEILSLGAQRAFATAYQSCEAWSLNPLDQWSRNLEGVIITGQHRDGVGNKREIADLGLVQDTHPYLSRSPSNQCYPVWENPLIYDYGGKPYPDEKNHQLNFFLNSGSGTQVLGTDCSGYVFSALAAVGVRLKRGVDPKPYQVNGVGARMYLNPEANGLDCFQKVSLGFGSSLRPGDLIASTGHIVILDQVGPDPLGIKDISHPDQCDGLSAEDLNFTLSQSSPSLMGVGINKFLARDYIPTNHIFHTQLLDYARRVCRAHMAGRVIPQGYSNFAIVRLREDASCLADRSIELTGQACVSTCWSSPQDTAPKDKR